jgi:hypothetical protein
VPQRPGTQNASITDGDFFHEKEGHIGIGFHLGS